MFSSMQQMISGKAHLAPVQDGAKVVEVELREPPELPISPEFLADLPAPGQPYEPQQPITRRLKALIRMGGHEGAFLSAVGRVCQHGVPELDQILTLDQFYYFVDAVVRWIPALRVWEQEGNILHERTDYLRITQFYYFFNQPELQALQSPIDPATGKRLTPLSLWLREFAVEWGAFLDTKESARYLDTYKFGPEYSYQDYAGGANGIGYETFNDWFSRAFKEIDVQRPVARPDDDRVIAFPAESTFVGQWAINTRVPEGEPMEAPPSIVVKHVEWPIPELLKDSEFADEFEGGILVHSFLNVFDYHRQHAPASGKILEAKFIPGQVYLQVELHVLDGEGRETQSSDLPNVVVPERYLDADDATGYQFVQCRGLMVLQTRIGKIAILPMGMAQVSSVVFATPPDPKKPQKFIRLTPEEKEGKSYDKQVKLLNEKIADALVHRFVKKGDLISTFLFGGSDIVMVFERQSNINVRAQVGVHYPIRSQFGYSNIAELLEF